MTEETSKITHIHEIAYSMTLAFGIPLHVKQSANAWWMSKEKLQNLIAAFSIGCTIPEACLHAGITVKQYKYFVQLYPDFKEARKGYRSTPVLLARKVIVNAIRKGDVKVSMWYLSKTRPEEFGNLRQRGYYKKSSISLNAKRLTPPVLPTAPKTEAQKIFDIYEEKFQQLVRRDSEQR